MAGALLALGALVAACSNDREPGAESTGAETTPSASEKPTGSGTPSALPPTALSGAAGGLTIRYLDTDGKIKTLRVEDFGK
jgi:hypothetical protein